MLVRSCALALLLGVPCADPAQHTGGARALATGASRSAVDTIVDATSTGDGISLRVNVPACRLDVLHGDSVIARMPVAIGMPTHRTPRGEYAVRAVVWNPWWIPPPSYWARKEHVTPPGPDNPMGRVKLSLGNAIFLHATPFATSVGTAASHGCLRMREQDAIALAREVIRWGGASIPESTVTRLTTVSRDTLTVPLPRPVPVRLEYALVEVDGDTLRLFPDVYGLAAPTRREEVMAVLDRAGVDTMRVRGDLLAQSLRRSRRARVALSLARLLGEAP